MSQQSKNILFIEQKLIYLVLVLFKMVRYVFRIFYKIVRLIYRFLKKMIYNFLVFIAPHVEKLQDRIYLRACKAFDIKIENLRK